MYKIARNQQRKIQDQCQLGGNVIKKDYKVVKTLFIMTASFYITVTPLFIFMILWEVITESLSNEYVKFGTI